MTTILSERDRVKQKIAKLLNVTLDRGATENEANMAAEKAASLLEHYNITLDEVQIRAISSKLFTTTSSVYHNNWTLGGHTIAREIAKLCDCVYYHKSKSFDFCFFGLPHDGEYALFLYEFLSGAILSELEAYKLSPAYAELAKDNNKISMNKAFIKGMEERLAYRLSEMIVSKKQSEHEKTGRALVVVKMDKVKEDFENSGVRLVTKRTYERPIKDWDSYKEGKKAAEKLGLGRGVNQKTAGVLS